MRIWSAMRGLAAQIVALAGLVVLAGCAMPPSNDPEALAAYREANDPLEPMNRYFFDLNNFADEILMKPLAGWYYIALPDFAQDGIRNAVNNVRTPVILANDLFQGEFERAGTTFGRFLVNSTLGLGGLFDVAEKMGLERHDEDFGQTMAVAGMDEGPYLVLPLVGPSNPRDAFGKIVDAFLDPMTYLTFFTSVGWINTTRNGLDIVDFRARNLQTLDQIKKGSLDYYATVRSLYRQRRADEISNGNPNLMEGPESEPEETSEVRPIIMIDPNASLGFLHDSVVKQGSMN
jgi:phospholipid-binding lipoprotein MlaA